MGFDLFLEAIVRTKVVAENMLDCMRRGRGEAFGHSIKPEWIGDGGTNGTNGERIEAIVCMSSKRYIFNIEMRSSREGEHIGGDEADMFSVWRLTHDGVVIEEIVRRRVTADSLLEVLSAVVGVSYGTWIGVEWCNEIFSSPCFEDIAREHIAEIGAQRVGMAWGMM